MFYNGYRRPATSICLKLASQYRRRPPPSNSVGVPETEKTEEKGKGIRIPVGIMYNQTVRGIGHGSGIILL